MNSLVSIIIPTYNRATIIQKALDSVLSQTYLNWECLVVDDGSTDDSLDILERYHQLNSRIRYFKRDRFPKGAPTCRNIGLQNATGDYIIYLDSDDYLLPFCLEQRMAVFEKYTSYDFLVFPMAGQYKETIKKKEIPNSADFLVNFLSANLPWSIMCPIWKTTFLNKLGGFTEGYPRFNDPELMIRALLQPNVLYKVLKQATFDCVYLPSNKTTGVFENKVYQSLILFIPDTVQNLNQHDKALHKHYLALYLHFWFKYIFVPLKSSKVMQSFSLIMMFYKKSVISFSRMISLVIRLILFSISNLVLKQPINKLTHKELYN